MTRRLTFGLLVFVPLAVVAIAVYASFIRDDGYTQPLVRVVGPAPEAAHAAVPSSSAPSVPGVSLASVDAFYLRLNKPPRAGLVFDLDSGSALWRVHPERTVPIASLTKIMTALLVVERTRPNEPVRITPAALRYSGSGVGVLPKGRRVRLETLFVREMNEQAREWGLDCTHFASSHGLEDGNRSCARDLAVLTRLAMQQPRIRRIVRREQVDFRFPIKGHRLWLSGHNPLQRLGYPGTLGLKTGYTDAAGRCFVGVVRRGGRTLGVVLLNSKDPAKHAPKLLDAAFATELVG